MVEVFVRVASRAEARGIADGEAVARIDDDLRKPAPVVDVEGLLEGRRCLGRAVCILMAIGSLRDGEQVGGEECLPTAQNPALCRLHGCRSCALPYVSEARVKPPPGEFNCAPVASSVKWCRSAALPSIRPKPVHCEELRGAGPSRPLRVSSSLNMRLTPADTGSALLRPRLRAQHLHLIVRGLGKEIVGMLDGRDAGIVALIAVERREPEEMPLANDAADACAPQNARDRLECRIAA